jgi:hypothetical protein
MQRVAFALLTLCLHCSVAQFATIHEKLVPVLKEISEFDAGVLQQQQLPPVSADSQISRTSAALKRLEAETELSPKYVSEVESAAATVLAAAKQDLPDRENAADSFRQKCAACFEPSAAAQTQDPGWQQHCALCYVQSEMARLQQEMDAVKAKREGFESQAAKESQRLQALSTQLAKVKQEFDAFRPPASRSPAEKRVDDLQRDLAEAKKELELERSHAINGDAAAP